MSSLAASTWLTRFRETKTQHGKWAAWQLVLDRLGKRLFSASVTNVVRLDAKDLDKLQSPPEFSFRFLSADEVRKFSLDPQNELGPEFVARAEAGRDFCFAVLAGERLANYGWYALGSIEAEHGGGLAMSFPPNMAYMYKGFTHADFRGQRLHGIAMGLALRALGQRGVEQLISTVDWTNWASLKSCYRLGYTDLGRILSIGPACCPITLASRAAKRLGVRFGGKANLHGRSSAS